MAWWFGDGEGEAGSTKWAGGAHDVAVVDACDVAGDCEAEAGATAVSIAGFVESDEPFEDVASSRWRNAGAVVVDVDGHDGVVLFEGDAGVGGGVSGGVVDQVAECAREQHRAALNAHGFGDVGAYSVVTVCLHDDQVTASRPSDALEARAQVDENLQHLLLGLGAVALLVGGVGIANVMIISVLERRGEIGLRRGLGATRRHIATQFVLESAGLAALGGMIGTLVGVAVTYGYARQQDWLVDIPAQALGGGIVAALLLGALAGLYPATRAARLDPADAVRPK